MIEARAFAAAKAVYDSARSARELPQTPMMDLVKAIDFACAQEDVDGGDDD